MRIFGQIKLNNLNFLLLSNKYMSNITKISLWWSDLERDYQSSLDYSYILSLPLCKNTKEVFNINKSI